ncbi:hydroxymethylglutaryl-CoA reductase [Rhodococcus fascians]|nr:hydroxymethylglutaryl-CoA reductase [Rhodococcus fascians]MBY4058112.1 hydroxymethylglutaryl-CoA reductase [Rhodococcus fascians]MBY4069755.1 hydroxymethylglutaryl-CoA reductase [Rhodococcus fascians]
MVIEGLEPRLRVPERGHETEQARRRRLTWVREQAGTELKALDDFTLDATRLVGNIENLVGSVAMPVGLAGPLKFSGEHATGWITAPFATTEGALVASVSRGSYAISRAGSVTTRVLGQRMIRSPRFDFTDINSAHAFAKWVQDQHGILTQLIREVSQHAELTMLRPLQIGRSVDVLFEFETGDASGQNMTTACTWRSCLWIEQQLSTHPTIELRSFCVEGNAAGDKKLSHRALLNGRGTRVTAECSISGETLEQVFKVGQKDMVRAFNINVTGTALAGGISSNINVVNAIAAIFAATGQDMACVHESGAGILNIEPDGDGIYASLLLPALAIGTVGGGTSLPQQAAYLEMIGCKGDGRVARLAEVIAGFSLALDLSTLSAVIGGQFATAHERLGRNRPVDWFTVDDLTPSFFQRELTASDTHGEVEVVKFIDDAIQSSVISDLTQRVSAQKLVGLVPVDIHFADGAALELIVKAKPLDSEVVLAAHRMVSLAGGRLAEAWSRGSDASDLLGTHLRELELYRTPGPAAAIMPRCHGIYRAPDREAFLLLLERLGSDVILMNSADRPQDWSDEHIRVALDGIAAVHGYWLGREDELSSLEWLGETTGGERVNSMPDLWRGLFEHHHTEFPHIITTDVLAGVNRTIDTMGEWWPELEAMPRTLIHNDFNSRNIGLRTTPVDSEKSDCFELVAYDWELATIHVPQRDLVELLAYVLPPDVSAERVHALSEHHRLSVQKRTSIPLDPQKWCRGYQLALADFLIRRLSLYLMVHTVQRLPFIERVVATVVRLTEIERSAPPGHSTESYTAVPLQQPSH